MSIRAFLVVEACGVDMALLTSCAFLGFPRNPLGSGCGFLQISREFQGSRAILLVQAADCT